MKAILSEVKRRHPHFSFSSMKQNSPPCDEKVNFKVETEEFKWNASF